MFRAAPHRSASGGIPDWQARSSPLPAVRDRWSTRTSSS